MQKKATRAGLRLLILDRSAGNFDPWLAHGNSNFRRIPTIPRTDRSLLKVCLGCLHQQYFMVNACFLSGSLDFWYTLDRMPLWSAPSQNSGHFTRVSLLPAGRIKHILWDSTGTRLWKLASNFLWSSFDFPFSLFSFASFRCNES